MLGVRHPVSFRVPQFFRENALTLAIGALFVASLIGQIFAGHAAFDAEARDHGQPGSTLGTYLTSGHFVEAIFENWESEFLQMGVFVVLTKFLKQKGSSESKKLDEHEEVDDDPRDAPLRPDTPWPVRRGGWILFLYERSLSLALFALFALSFALHAVGGAKAASVEAVRHGAEAISTLAYVRTSRFWFESFQNWQSEFLSVGALIVLSIFLRERGSSQSKPVAKPHAETED